MRYFRVGIVLGLALTLMPPVGAVAKGPAASVLFVDPADSWSEVSNFAQGLPIKVEISLIPGSSKDVKKGGLSASFTPKSKRALLLPIKLAFGTCTIEDSQGACMYGKFSFTPFEDGVLKVKYAGTARSSSAVYVNNYTLLKKQDRSVLDLPDEGEGFMLHAVYVVPKGVVDRKRDTRGHVSAWLTQSSEFLDSKVGDHWLIDSYKGAYDVSYMASGYSLSEMFSGDFWEGFDGIEISSASDKLLEEFMRKNSGEGVNRKEYVFFIEAAILPGNACGRAPTPGNTAVVAAGWSKDNIGCQGDIGGWSNVSNTVTHEVLHSFGVDHVADPADLMSTSPDRPAVVSFDRLKSLYYGGDSAGVDVSKLRVWSKSAVDLKMAWPCSSSASSVYYCGFGESEAVDANSGCSFGYKPEEAVLQELVDGVWVKSERELVVDSKGCGERNPNRAGWIAFLIVPSRDLPGSVTYRVASKSGEWEFDIFRIVYQR